MPRKRKRLSETLGNSKVAELIDRAKQGDASVLPDLRKLLDRDPTIWKQAADLGHHVEESWINMIAGTDLTLAESLRRKLAEMKVELSGDNPSPLERLLIERIGICWLTATYADNVYAESTECSLPQARFLVQRQQVNHERLVSATKALAQVRNLLPSPFRFNSTEWISPTTARTSTIPVRTP